MDDNPISLTEELAKCNGKTVLVGVRSSFFYIGPAEEAREDLPMLGLMSRFCVTLASGAKVSKKALQRAMGKENLGSRKVIKTYPRDPGENELVILIEGSEFGAFWTRDEYLAGRKALMEALGESDASSIGKAT